MLQGALRTAKKALEYGARLGRESHPVTDASDLDAKVHRLADYKPREWMIPNANLVFDLTDATRVKVSSALDIEFNDEEYSERMEETLPPLSLDVDESVIITGLKIDGKELSRDEWKRDSRSITIFKPKNKVFKLEVETEIDAAANKSNEGLYKSNGTFLTQIEPDAFMKIAPCLNRTDNKTAFNVTIIANQEQCPKILSNGNIQNEKDLGDGRHSAEFYDPRPKPIYIFAVVAGEFDMLEATAQSDLVEGDVKLEIYSDPGNKEKCHHGMFSLKRTIDWLKEEYGLHPDLDAHRIVIAANFNGGAMENRGLNIFNAERALADPNIATDEMYADIFRVFGHEFIHKYFGNIISIRDLMEFTLKEGLTTFLDKELAASIAPSKAVARIQVVKDLKRLQYPEDSSGNVHPIQPKEIKSFYNLITWTVYLKGAEVVRMIHTLIGEKNFKDGIKIYHEQNKDKSARVEDFIEAMEQASGLDLQQFFETWYSQRGRPKVEVKGEYNAEAKTYTMKVVQKPAHNAEPGVEQKPYYFPLKIGLLAKDAKGGKVRDIPLQLECDQSPHNLAEGILHISDWEQIFVFTSVDSEPTPSLARDLSAPADIEFDYNKKQLLHLAENDSNGFNRYEAMQRLIGEELRNLMQNPEARINETIFEAYEKVFEKLDEDRALAAELMHLPTVANLNEGLERHDYEAAKVAIDKFKKAIAERFESEFKRLYKDNCSDEPFAWNNEGIVRRKLKNAALSYLISLEGENIDRAIDQFHKADNLTERLHAYKLVAQLGPEHSEKANELNEKFYEMAKSDPMLLKQYLAAFAESNMPGLLEKLTEFMCKGDLDLNNTNILAAIYGGVAVRNLSVFHTPDGSGYKFLADRLTKLGVKTANPGFASAFMKAFGVYPYLSEEQQRKMKEQLMRIYNTPNMGVPVKEKIEKILDISGDAKKKVGLKGLLSRVKSRVVDVLQRAA